MTEVSVFLTDIVYPFLDGDALVGYIWCVRNGKVVAGSQTVPAATAPVFNANYNTIVKTFIQTNLLAMMGGGPPPAADYLYPNALNANNEWGIESLPINNNFKTRPFVALAYTADFTFGALNIPALIDTTDPAQQRQWFFRIESAPGSSDSIAPSIVNIESYVGDKGFPPNLLTLELNAE